MLSCSLLPPPFCASFLAGPARANGGFGGPVPATGRLKMLNYTSFVWQGGNRRAVQEGSNRTLLESSSSEDDLPLQPRASRSLLSHAADGTDGLVPLSAEELPAGTAGRDLLQITEQSMGQVGMQATVASQAATMVLQNYARNQNFLWGGYFKVQAMFGQFPVGTTASIKLGSICQGCYRNDPSMGTTVSPEVTLIVQ